MYHNTRYGAGLVLAASALLGTVAAQTAAPASELTLRQAYEAAWARQPEALGLPARREAARAQQSAASSWFAAPAALDLAEKSDRWNRSEGAREYQAGVSVPVWLPGERGRSQALADAEAEAVESRTLAGQLRVAAWLREAWWDWQRTRIEADIARDQRESAARLAADVQRRVAAGDLARSDRHQAEGALAAAEAQLAQAEAGAAQSLQRLRAGTGLALNATTVDTQAEVAPSIDAPAVDHGQLRELQDRVAVVERTAELTRQQSRANPELSVATARDRSIYGAEYQQTVTLGLRFPFGGGARHDARIARAQADADELRAVLTLERQRIDAEREAARVRVDSARTRLAAAERRAVLARESRGFFDKSFRLGETDLPTRLRIEAEAAEAERQAARALAELGAAVSGWRQALGLLP